MTVSAGPWTARLAVRLDTPRLADWLERALRPEASREVPRTRAEVLRTGESAIEVAITARDVGALRAALNTYLGWIHLSLETARTAAASGTPPGP